VSRRHGAAGAVVVVLATLVGACADGRDPADAPAATSDDGGSPVTFVTLGTDETEGRGLGFPESLREAWPQVVFRTTLPQRTVFVNLADGGTTVAEAVDRQLPAAQELEPTLATVWLTSTDADAGTAPDAYEADLEQLVRGLQQRGRTRVLVATSTAEDPAPSLDAAVVRVVQITGADLVDLRQLALRGDQGPDARSHDALAKAFGRALGEVG
jgi:hypothetical protein